MSGSPTVRFRRRTPLVGIMMALVLAIASLLGILLGDAVIDPGAILFGELSTVDRYIVYELRLPRVYWGIIVGYAFGLAGTLFQNVTRNPLGSPDVLGVIAGSTTGALIAITIVGTSSAGVGLFALAGAAITAGLLVVAQFWLKASLMSVIIAGVGVTLFLNAINSWLLLRASEEIAYSAGRWLIGTLEYASWDRAPTGLVATALLSVALTFTVRWYQLLGFNTDQNRIIGASPAAMSGVLLSLGIAFTGLGVWAVGPMALLPFAAPQIARIAARTPTPPFFLSGLTGSIVLVIADLVARKMLGASALPVGTVVLIIGGVLLLWLTTFRPQSMGRV